MGPEVRGNACVMLRGTVLLHRDCALRMPKRAPDARESLCVESVVALNHRGQYLARGVRRRDGARVEECTDALDPVTARRNARSCVVRVVRRSERRMPDRGCCLERQSDCAIERSWRHGEHARTRFGSLYRGVEMFPPRLRVCADCSDSDD